MNQQNQSLIPQPQAGQVMQQVQTAYTTAISVQQPRDLASVDKRLCEEATLAAEEFFYGWGAGKNQIEGPSIKLALAAARCYGNCAVDSKDVQETEDSWIFTAVFIDIETGFTLARAFHQPKDWTVYGKHDEQRKAVMRFQIGQSKAIRNVVINCVPTGLIKRAMEAAKGKVSAFIQGKIAKEGIDSVVAKAFDALESQGIDSGRALAKFHRLGTKAITVDDLVLIKSDLNAIANQQDTAEALYPFLEGQGASDGDSHPFNMSNPQGGSEAFDDAVKPHEPKKKSGGKRKTKTKKPQKLTRDQIDRYEQDIDAATVTTEMFDITENVDRVYSSGALPADDHGKLTMRMLERCEQKGITLPSNLADGSADKPELTADPDAGDGDAVPSPGADAKAGGPADTLTAFGILSRELHEAGNQSLREEVMQRALDQKATGAIGPKEYDELKRVDREMRGGNGDLFGTDKASEK